MGDHAPNNLESCFNLGVDLSLAASPPHPGNFLSSPHHPGHKRLLRGASIRQLETDNATQVSERDFDMRDVVSTFADGTKVRTSYSESHNDRGYKFPGTSVSRETTLAASSVTAMAVGGIAGLAAATGLEVDSDSTLVVKESFKMHKGGVIKDYSQEFSLSKEK